MATLHVRGILTVQAQHRSLQQIILQLPQAEVLSEIPHTVQYSTGQKRSFLVPSRDRRESWLWIKKGCWTSPE